MIHRHLDVPSNLPAEDLPLAAIVDILERGDLGDWQPLARAIAREPHGGLADDVMRLVDAHPIYGASPLWRAWIDRRRAMAEGGGEPRRVAGLAGLRRDAGLTQVALAPRIGVSQSDLSKLERRADVRLSSLRDYCRSLGGRLRLLFTSPTREIEIAWPDPQD